MRKLSFLFILFFVGLFSFESYAQKTNEELLEENKELYQKLIELQNQVKTLSSELTNVTTTLHQITRDLDKTIQQSKQLTITEELPTDVVTLQQELIKARLEADRNRAIAGENAEEAKMQRMIAEENMKRAMEQEIKARQNYEEAKKIHVKAMEENKRLTKELSECKNNN